MTYIQYFRESFFFLFYLISHETVKEKRQKILNEEIYRFIKTDKNFYYSVVTKFCKELSILTFTTR